VRCYYGTVKHTEKAVYQAYFGWFDGNPAHLDPLPPREAAKKYVASMGGSERVLEQGVEAYDDGDYRWAAMLLNHLVFAEPENRDARRLLANVYDQLGYQAESAPWRDVYLSGAHELRHGTGGSAIALEGTTALLRELPLHRLFDAMGTRIDPEKAESEYIKINFVFTDRAKSFVLTLENSVLNYREGEPDPEADATFRVTTEKWLELATGQGGVRDLLFSDDVDIEGSRLRLLTFLALMGTSTENFPIVTP